MTDFYWTLLFIAIAYFIMTLGFATWSESNNRYGKFGMDMTYGLLWPIILAKWFVRLPGRLKAYPNEGAAKVFKDVWNG